MSEQEILTADQITEKIYDHNMAQFDRYDKTKGAKDAIRIYRRTFAGDMATLGREGNLAAGYPIGSVTPFIIDHTGSPVIYTACVAEHTKNAQDNGKASLMLRQVEKQHYIETGWRLTCIGDLIEVQKDERERVKASYLRHYPEIESYTKVHDFYFFRLNIVVARVIMGFGRISWVDADELAKPSTLSYEEESQIIEHMNNDHQSALKHYLKQMQVDVKEHQKAPRMVAVNQFGATIDYRHRLYFLEFKEEANDMRQIRKQLVNLAKVK